MVKAISVSDEAYNWLLKKASRKTIATGHNISIAEIVDELIKRGG